MVRASGDRGMYVERKEFGLLSNLVMFSDQLVPSPDRLGSFLRQLRNTRADALLGGFFLMAWTIFFFFFFFFSS